MKVKVRCSKLSIDNECKCQNISGKSPLLSAHAGKNRSYEGIFGGNPFLVVMIAIRDRKSVSFLKLGTLIPTAQRTIFVYLIP